MLTPRIVLGAVVLFAMVRFFATPTWPCAFVVAVALVVAVLSHVISEVKHANDLERISDQSRHAAEVAKTVSDTVAAVSERVDRLERVRALGG